MKNFADLTEREVLAVAISAEEEDSRIYMTFAEDLAERYPESSKLFEQILDREDRKLRLHRSAIEARNVEKRV